MLSASRAEAIIGDEDPAESAAVAHTAAWALMGVGDDEFDDEAVACAPTCAGTGLTPSRTCGRAAPRSRFLARCGAPTC